jgi:mediator of RNA polymerase II transcription subunit 14
VRADGLQGQGQSMPGILTMASRGAEGALGSGDGESRKRKFDDKLTNGERNASRMDTPAGGANGAVSAPSVNGTSGAVVSTAKPAVDQKAQLPPELEHVALELFHPLGKMLLRIGQECYNDLNDVLQKMADVAPNMRPNGGMTNGHSIANGGGDGAEVSRQKKLLLMHFAQVNRAKFIKMQVLAEWGRRCAVDISKCIDLLQWQKEQVAHMDSVDEIMELTKVWSSEARDPNPDIRTAMEILATGKADWIPDVSLPYCIW